MSAQARILFVDDEVRVLTAMRAMFRRDYEVHVANSGAEALEVLREHAIDVVVSDQRMPEMTGVEMLKEARQVAPQTMRVLLTGYADLAAIEHAINESEVFRYLMKPCAREQLKETVSLAVDAARASAATARPAASRAAAPAGEAGDGAAVPDDVALLVLSEDQALSAAVREAVAGAGTVCTASTLEEAVRLLGEQPVGVVVTDLAVDEDQITALTTELKREAPELVTIVASDRSDAHLMIDLINHGQVFRFLLKPVSVGQSRIWLASALRRYRELASHPEIVDRYRADGAGSTPASSIVSRMLSGFRSLRQRSGRDRAGVDA
ncbi:MAG: response regulator [Pseudomonadales bacterium]|jgi:serine/threonine-protein kinase|nr:response regulator [Pseudomonadales bacterium]